MLEPHPPHHTPNTWRDFVIHIATIVVGLLIAVSLEQTVEYIHHRQEIAETREALHDERLDNYTRFAKYVQQYHAESLRQKANMALLVALQHPAQNSTNPSARLKLGLNRNQFTSAAWHTAQTSGVLALMPADEVQADERIYNALQDISNQNEEEWLALNEANRFTFTDDNPAHLSPPQLAEEISLLQKMMMKHYLRGNFMGYPKYLDPGFADGPSEAELDAFHNFIAVQHTHP